MYKLLAIFAHPDDESFRAGGILAILADCGVNVQVLTLTRGQAGSCGDPPVCSQEELPQVREAELKCACNTLGIQPPIIWDYEDGKLIDVNENIMIQRIIDLIDKLQPEILLTWPPDGLSGHPDHMMVSRWATKAFEKKRRKNSNGPNTLYYMAVPSSLAKKFNNMNLHSVSDDEINLVINVLPVWGKKLKAIRCHQTQISESPLLSHSDEIQRQFLGTEYFVISRNSEDKDFLSKIFTKKL
jgi:LmbE family N-acetylglucosaminyl deacetylase